MEFVAAPVRQRKPVVAFADAGELGRQIGQMLRDEMNDLPFPLDAALHGEHTGGEDVRRWRSYSVGQITERAPAFRAALRDDTPPTDRLR
jgi:hypothetical protein